MRKDQYLIKDAFRRPIVPRNLTNSKYYLELEDKTYIADSGKIMPLGISLIDPKVCSAILCNYSRLK